MIEIIAPILAGAVNGFGLALLGYLKNSVTEDFDIEKLAPTAITGAIIGGIAGYGGLSYDQGVTWATSTSAILVIDLIRKAIMNRLFPKKEDKPASK
jgi:Na+/proline symporter